MADPIKGIGPAGAGITPPSAKARQESESSKAEAVRDKVSFSGEALDLAEVLETASKTRGILERTGFSLGLAQEFSE